VVARGIARVIARGVARRLVSLRSEALRRFKQRSVARVGVHKHFGARKKTGSESIFLRIDIKIRFFLFLQMLFTEKVSVLADFFKKIDLFKKD
jgi:hypothetical protein